MVTQKIILENKERFSQPHEISPKKIDAAIEKAVNKLERNIPRFTDRFPNSPKEGYIYKTTKNDGWVGGMYTGCYLLAYELTGNPKFRDVISKHIDSFADRCQKKQDMQFHDVGFAFSPSCVAAYKVLGDEKAYRTALEAAEYFYNLSYCKKGGFILRCADGARGVEGSCRTMMDTLMNVPLLYWAGAETGKKEYTEAAVMQYKTTEKYLIRDDASSYHHYQFDINTFGPVKGLSYQGNRDESTWSRGHAWGVYGFPIAYSYTKDEHLFDLHRDVTYYFLNHLPEDLIPYWDFDFISGDEPRDSSAAAIAVCGMLEMIKHLPDNAPQKEIFKNAASMMLEAIIDTCTNDMGCEYDGLIYKVTGANKILTKDAGIGVETCAPYGDYHYLEALMRYKNPEWKMYW